MDENQSKEKRGMYIKKWQLILIVTLMLLLISGGVIIGVFCGNQNHLSNTAETLTSNVSQSASPDIDPNVGEWNGELEAKSSDESEEAEGIQIPGYPVITMSANSKNINIVLVNPKQNSCYFTYEIVLDDTGETIYKSKQIPPGKAISNIELTKTLKAGSYNATIKITTASLIDLSPMNGANQATEIVVE